ncbi:type I phosphomannose isomerase catalytic subunit [Acetanaerobacterium elongatum]|uniref:Phosphohexomutase n=1 Tax=Acetanaerobacterium elongatum TaxID=258515 RepID=A0A1H0H6P2_9FIRM|nr:type I phosphomannose isomerase catalytic subunit [Acetanaerobacterium elongatum]SDO14886.1 mannose-6-phosphate isomerase, type 1 [Acetanaerobacterium elongatum]
MPILKLKAALKDYIWGGTQLKEKFHKQSVLDTVAESWELSCHPDGASVIEGGAYDGLTLTEYISKAGQDVLGEHCKRFEFFPILIKLIDAKHDLSIQVHPANDYALRVEGGYGKTEMWYIVDCEEGARLFYGFKKKITKEEFRRHIEQNTLETALNSVKVHKGEVFFIDAGTIHAIGSGILIAEIQQNSNTTYRVYDYGRKGLDGKPRPLHVEKALDVTVTAPPHPSSTADATPTVYGGYTLRRLAGCEYFTVHIAEITQSAAFMADGTSFHSLVCIEGQGTLSGAGESYSIKKGDSFFIPAGFGAYTLSGGMTVIKTVV